MNSLTVLGKKCKQILSEYLTHNKNAKVSSHMDEVWLKWCSDNMIALLSCISKLAKK